MMLFFIFRIPPKVISKDRKHAWFGATVLMKHIPDKMKKKKVPRKSMLTGDEEQ